MNTEFGRTEADSPRDLGAEGRNAATPLDPVGLKRARELAQWKLGYRAWADAILEAYFNPESAEWKEAHEWIHGDDE